MNVPESPIFIDIYSCGGTIDKVYFDAKSDYKVGDPQIDAIFKNANVGFEYRITELLRKDSLEMTMHDREMVRSRINQSEFRRVLVTHGTDTMPETARSLLGLPNKVIVLTGSMTPARFQTSDAEFNIGCAVGALMSQPNGVYVAMNGCVFPADSVRKNRELGRFELAKHTEKS